MFPCEQEMCWTFQLSGTIVLAPSESATIFSPPLLLFEVRMRSCITSLIAKEIRPPTSFHAKNNQFIGCMQPHLLHTEICWPNFFNLYDINFHWSISSALAL